MDIRYFVSVLGGCSLIKLGYFSALRWWYIHILILLISHGYFQVRCWHTLKKKVFGQKAKFQCIHGQLS
jgi:hypothetical protein